SMALEGAGTRLRVRSREAFIECPYEYAQIVMRQMTELGIPDNEIRPEWGSLVGFSASVPCSLAESAENLFNGYLQRGFISSWYWGKKWGAISDDVS
ncbi:MAG: hypothetical protein RQ767_00835, partial [Thermovirgaceae bacterium]|nr:hypothetical protein [Thermovirgaceae bacterium]